MRKVEKPGEFQYFKGNLSADEKAELFEIIENYHKGLIPLVVPMSLINHYVRKLVPVIWDVAIF